MFTRKPRLQLEKFAINGAKRLLQHNRHFCDMARSRWTSAFGGRAVMHRASPANDRVRERLRLADSRGEKR